MSRRAILSNDPTGRENRLVVHALRGIGLCSWCSAVRPDLLAQTRGLHRIVCEMFGLGVQLEGRHVRCGMRFRGFLGASGCAASHGYCFVCVVQL